MSKKILIYYLVLFLILLVWNNTDAPPATPLRIAFLVALILPGLRERNALIPAALICFWGVSSNGYAYTYMPYTTSLYTVIVLLAVLLNMGKSSPVRLYEKKNMWIFLIYVTVVNVCTKFGVDQLSHTLLITILFLSLISDGDKEALNIIECSFIFMTIGISILSLSAREQILLNSVSYDIDSERIAWVDPNYMGVQVEMGAIVALFKLFDEQVLSLPVKLISILAITLALPTILMTGSRGAVLCIAVVFLLLFLVTDTKLWVKLIIVSAIIAFCVYLYTNEFFDLFLTRVQNDESSGSGRLDIWKAKYDAFITDGNILTLLFGFGSFGGMMLGYSHLQGFHNDYLSFLCCFGVIGFVLFLFYLLLPCKIVNKSSYAKYKVIAGTVFLLVSITTLEPFGLGYFTFYAFVLYLFLLAKNSNVRA